MLSERSQTEKTHIIQFHLRNDQNRQIQRDRNGEQWLPELRKEEMIG